MTVLPNFLYYGLDETSRLLIHKVCGDTPSVELAPLDKGLSGSITLMGRWLISGTPSKFHVFKIGDARKLRHEYEAITHIAAPLVRDFPNVTYDISEDGVRGILSQEFLGDSSGQVQSLKQFIEAAPSGLEVVSALRRLYSERIIHWIPSVQSEPITTTLGQELADWLRKADLQKALIEVGHAVLAESVLTRFGMSVDDIPRRVQSIARETVRICRGPVHGDLHAQNIVLDNYDRLNLIDFGWTGIRWRAVDYIWLECSLKFVVCSPYALLDDLLYLDELADDAWALQQPLDLGRFRQMLHGRSLEKIAAGVCLIRQYAREQTPMLDLRTYQAGLALMAYSLTTFPQLNRVYLLHSVARYLTLLHSRAPDSGPYDRLYGATDVLWPDRPGRMVRRAVATVSPGRALDLGCGDGKNLVYLEEHGWSVTGIDISGLAIAALQRRAARYFGDRTTLRADVIRSDVASYSYPAMAYDLVIAYGLYHCLSDDDMAVVHRGILRSMKPGGLFAFATFNDTRPVPEGHETGDLFLRPANHIFELVGDALELIAQEVGEIQETHLPLVGEHLHGLTWALFRKP